MSYGDEYFDDTPRAHPAVYDDAPTGFAPALLEQRLGRVMIVGPKGSGKTHTALQWATILADGERIAVIDTERRGAAAFGPDGVEIEMAEEDFGAAATGVHPPFLFWHHPWTGDHTPGRLENLAESAAVAVGPGGVVVVDTVSPFWSGKGGVQDIVDASEQGWKVGSPIHRQLFDTLTHLPCHVIVVVRAKTDHVIEERDGVHSVREVAVGFDQRSGVQFEFDVVLSLRTDLSADIRISGTRVPEITPQFVPLPDQLLTIAAEYRDALGQGIARLNRAQVAELVAPFDRVTDQRDKIDSKKTFFLKFGAPENIVVADFDDALAYVRTLIADYFGEDPPAEPEPEMAEDGLPAEPEHYVTAEEEAADEPGEPEPDDALDGKTVEDLRLILTSLGGEPDGRWGDQRLRSEIRKAMDDVDPDEDEGSDE